MLGIDEDRRVFYEGPSNIGIAIWPSPFVSVATPIRTDQDLNSIPCKLPWGKRVWCSVKITSIQLHGYVEVGSTIGLEPLSPKCGRYRRIQHFPVILAVLVLVVS